MAIEGARVSAPARITQAEIDRAVKAARKAGGTGARVVVDLANRRLEILIGEAAMIADEPNPWEDEDA